MEAISQLTHALTGKKRLQDCSEDELRQIVRLYPFFGPAQLLLAKKKKELHDDQAVDVSARAALFVPNPLWFEELMDEQTDEAISEQEPFAGTIRDDAADDTTHDDSTYETTHDTILETPSTVEEVIAQPAFVEEEISAGILPGETILEEPVTEEEVIDQTPVADASETFTQEDMADDTAVAEEPVLEEDISSLADIEDPDSDEPDTYDEVLPEMEQTTQGDEAPLRPIPALKMEPIDPAKAELSFEPYHTVDYFASQGIRFREDEKPKDRLGLQLKSFTEWLKTLKKIPAAEITASTTRQEETRVEQMAQVSVLDPEVVTEAMAEVWEKQGNTIKAQELYRKLSLLDPAKSAYFAAKIEHLKQL